VHDFWTLPLVILVLVLVLVVSVLTLVLATSVLKTYLGISIPFDRSRTSCYWHSVVTIALSCIIFEIKRDISRTSQFFHTPPAYSMPPLGRSPSKPGWQSKPYCHKVWDCKAIMMWLPDSENVWGYVYPFRHITRTWRTPSQADTARPHRPRLCIAWRGKGHCW